MQVQQMGRTELTSTGCHAVLGARGIPLMRAVVIDRQNSHHRLVTISVTIQTRLSETRLCSNGRKNCSLLLIIKMGSLLKWAVVQYWDFLAVIETSE